MDFHREYTRVFLSEYFRGNANICQGYILLGNVKKRDESSCLKSIFFGMLYRMRYQAERGRIEDYKRGIRGEGI